MKTMEEYFSQPFFYRCTALLLIAGLTACANTRTPIHSDPFERVNRSIFTFNDTVDRVALQPVARAYKRTLPQEVRTSVSNFFSNLGDVPVMVNYLLQGQVALSAESLMRITINTLFGVGGLFDVAQAAGLAKRQTDFGLTLGHYGVPMGPYLVLPLLGPSTVRDATGLVFDYSMNPMSYANPAILSNGLYGGRLVNTRAALLDASDLLNDVALDKYLFVRNAYRQRRAYLSADRRRSNYDERTGAPDPVTAPPNEQNIPSQEMIPPHALPEIRLRW